MHLVAEGGTEVVRAAKFVSDQLLDVELQAEDVAQAGKLNISVVNPAPGRGTSTSLDVTVAAASP